MKILINGEWCDSLSGKTFAVHNPATGDVVGEAPLCGEDDIRSAVEAADEAFGEWAARNPRDRGKILFFAAEEVRRRNTDLGALLTAEQGKPIREAVDEINGLQTYSSIIMPSQRGRDYQDLRGYGHAIVQRRPLGICARSSPGTCRRSSGLEDRAGPGCGNTWS